jgi:hypothetical protein
MMKQPRAAINGSKAAMHYDRSYKLATGGKLVIFSMRHAVVPMVRTYSRYHGMAKGGTVK